MRIRHITPAIIALLSLAGIYTSCKNSPEDNTTIAFSTLKAGAAYRLENSAKDFDRDSDLIYFDSAAIVMPTVIYNQDITALQDSILSIAFDTICTDHVEAMESFFGTAAGESGYTATEVPATPNEQFTADGITLIYGNVFSLSPKLLTYRVSNYTYGAGSANGVSINRYLTYYIPDHSIIGLDYIFTPEGLVELPGVIAAKARSMKSNIGSTDVKALPVDGDFYIDLFDNIVFVYQPSEVASYSQGEIAIPFYP